MANFTHNTTVCAGCDARGHTYRNCILLKEDEELAFDPKYVEDTTPYEEYMRKDSLLQPFLALE